MPNRDLHIIESGHLQYEQAGVDTYRKDNALLNGMDHSILYPGEGTAASNRIYFNNPDPNAHWIAVHSITHTEVVPLQIETYDGDDFGKDGVFSANTSNYLEVLPGDVIYGKFKRVSILKVGTSGYYDIRLIRGV